MFQNQKYHGLHALSESVDRKLLKLKKHEDGFIRGELFKASAYEGAPSFTKAPDYDNLFPHWGGFEMKYPIIEYRTHWNDLAKFVKLVVSGSDEEFKTQIGQRVNIDNVIDYYLFVNLLRATDNLGKNYYLARYDKSEPYFFVPWDLDGVMGIIQDGKRIPTTDDILSNGLFDRLLKVNPQQYTNKLKIRWGDLRSAEFSTENLLKRIDKLYNRLSSERIYEREQLVWPNDRSKEDHYEYLINWLKNRLEFLDRHFKSL